MTLRELLEAILKRDANAVAELQRWVSECPECRFHMERVVKLKGSADLRRFSELNDWENHRATVHRGDGHCPEHRQWHDGTCPDCQDGKKGG